VRQRLDQRLDQRQQETTGTERRRSKLTIAIDSSIGVIQDEQSQIKAARRQKKLCRNEAAKAQRTRDSLLSSRSGRARESDNDKLDLAAEALGAESPLTASRPSRKRLQRGHEPLQSMATAIQGLASSWVASDERSSSEIVAVERKVDAVERKLDGVTSKMDNILDAFCARAPS
jgi:chromosome segregation ATPase